MQLLEGQDTTGTMPEREPAENLGTDALTEGQIPEPPPPEPDPEADTESLPHGGKRSRS